MRPWCYQTADLPGVPATFKQSPEDFVVVERPLFEPSGEGEHLYVTLRKRGLTTHELIERLGLALSLKPAQIGYAGLKDRQATTTQTVSLPGVTPDRLEGLELHGVEILGAVPHRHKLRRGKLAGNAFEILLRDVDPARADDVARLLARLEQDGVPNYFGVQRFGVRLVNHLIGRALLLSDWAEAVALVCGCPSELEGDERARAARALFDAGRYAEAAAAWPGHYRAERAVVDRLREHPDGFRQAIRRLSRRERGFYLNALQSYLFNCLLEEVVAAGEPTPPFGELPGYKVRPSDAVLRDPALVAATLPGLDLPVAFRRARLTGDRRPLWLHPKIAHDWQDRTLRLAFELPSGAYATAILRELIKDDPPIPRC